MEKGIAAIKLIPTLYNFTTQICPLGVKMSAASNN